MIFMNKREADILKVLNQPVTFNQREISEVLRCSLGSVNKTLKNLRENGLLDERGMLTHKSRKILQQNKPQNAVILAAGFGMRMVPINTEVPKGLIEINGEPLIERLIKQLHEVGIENIYIVVGFLKEQYEYLIDKYSVRLIVNPDYAIKNNLHSLSLALEYVGNSYIIPCDVWFRDNPFSGIELYSWYMLGDETSATSKVAFNRNGEIVKAKGKLGNKMIGLCYMTNETACLLKEKVVQMSADSIYDNVFWEDALFEKFDISIYANVSVDAIEINTYEQLRELDADSKNLNAKAILTIANALGVAVSDIVNITVLKKGMTNRSFLFSCNGQKYIMRVPGEGTDKLINRKQEYAVYRSLDGKDISDDVVYISPESGYKITKYWEGAKVCDPCNFDDVRRCFIKLKQFHEMKLSVEHEFDLFEQIEKYEQLRGISSIYKDYKQTKRQVTLLKEFIDNQNKDYVLTHIDAVPDNFLFINIDGKQDIRLIDWEYAGMQDPHVDIAMFCIYSMYNEDQVDRAIDIYFDEKCDNDMRTKIYCYIAICGLLWSNWCEYKRSLGVDFGEYSLAQYRFAKVYSRKVNNLLGGYNE